MFGPFWLSLLLLAAGLAAYANSFDLPFVYDDQSSVIGNSNIRQLWPLKTMLTALTGPWQSAVAGRPVISLSLAVNYALGGLSPWGYHAWNLAVHILAGLALFGILRRTFAAPALASRLGAVADSLAFACTVVWLVHPLQTEVIDYVTQRTESTMGLFYLLTLYAAARGMSAPPERAWRWYAASIAASALGMGSKESMATAPLMVLLYDVVFQAGGPVRALRSRAGLYLGLAATWGIVVALMWPGPRSHSAGFSSGLTSWAYLLNQPAMIVRYLKLVFWPHGLVHDYGLPLSLSLTDALPYAVVVVALLLVTAALWRRHRALAFLGTWFFVTLAPSSSIVPIATEVGADRRMYLPLAAIVVLVVAGGWTLLQSLATRSSASTAGGAGGAGGNVAIGASRRNRVAAIALAAACLVLMALTLQRNSEYQSRTGIWQTVLDRRPHGRAHYNLGIELKEQGRREEAIREYELAVKDLPDAHYAVGFELEADGKYDEAIAHFREYIRLKPDDINVIRAYALLGRSLRSQGQMDTAADAFRQVLRMQPNHADARVALAEILLEQQRFDEAIREYREYVRLNPDNAAAHSGLGIALVGRDMESEAVHEFAKAVELGPGDAGARRNLGNALTNLGRLDEAVIQYRSGLAIAPNAVVLHNALGSVLAAQGKGDEALAEFRRSLALDPANEETRADMAAAYARLAAGAATPQR